MRSRRVKAEAAIIEISLMGVAIVAPDRWGVVVGNKLEVFWEDQVGWVWIRRMHSFPGSTKLMQYGAEYADPNSQLAAALYERYVNAPLVAKAQAAQRVRDATKDQPVDRLGTPSMWVAPIAWSDEA